MSKGSGRRPPAVDRETEAASWARTFERETWRVAADKLNREVSQAIHGVDLDERKP